MPHVRFTENLRRHVDCEDAEVPPGATVAECLASYFSERPGVRSYVLDDRGAVRQHIVIYLDGAPIHDRAGQSDPVTPSAEIYVFQALSGG